MEALLHRHENAQLNQRLTVGEIWKCSILNQGAGKEEERRQLAMQALLADQNSKAKKTKGRGLELNVTLASIAHLFSRVSKNADGVRRGELYKRDFWLIFGEPIYLTQQLDGNRSTKHFTKDTIRLMTDDMFDVIDVARKGCIGVEDCVKYFYRSASEDRVKRMSFSIRKAAGLEHEVEEVQVEKFPIDPEMAKELLDIYYMYDEDRTGRITEEMFCQGVNKMWEIDTVNAEQKDYWSEVDKKKKGYVTRAEFITWLQDTIFIDFEHLNKYEDTMRHLQGCSDDYKEYSETPHTGSPRDEGKHEARKSRGGPTLSKKTSAGPSGGTGPQRTAAQQGKKTPLSPSETGNATPTATSTLVNPDDNPARQSMMSPTTSLHETSHEQQTPQSLTKGAAQAASSNHKTRRRPESGGTRGKQASTSAGTRINSMPVGSKEDANAATPAASVEKNSPLVDPRKDMPGRTELAPMGIIPPSISECKELIREIIRAPRPKTSLGVQRNGSRPVSAADMSRHYAAEISKNPSAMENAHKVFCCDFKCGFKGAFDEVSAHENICTLNPQKGSTTRRIPSANPSGTLNPQKGSNSRRIPSANPSGVSKTAGLREAAGVRPMTR